jgi:hypothetical protein
MYYICIENGKVCGVLNYEPTVPSTVKVHQISDSEYATLTDTRHWFNTETMQIELINATALADWDRSAETAGLRTFLQETDWKVLRHIREKALGITTSITEDQYIELEQQRQQAAKQI